MEEERSLLSRFHEYLYSQQGEARHTVAHEITITEEYIVTHPQPRLHLVVLVNRPASNSPMWNPPPPPTASSRLMRMLGMPGSRK